MTFRVGVVYEDKPFTYTKVETDKDGWADAKKYLPADFDLCNLRCRGRSVIAGWLNGNTWEGLKVQREDEVLYWKRHEE